MNGKHVTMIEFVILSIKKNVFPTAFRMGPFSISIVIVLKKVFPKKFFGYEFCLRKMLTNPNSTGSRGGPTM